LPEIFQRRLTPRGPARSLLDRYHPPKGSACATARW
jgi:hypothetical protein